jgi:hypothetical protein
VRFLRRWPALRRRPLMRGRRTIPAPTVRAVFTG